MNSTKRTYGTVIETETGRYIARSRQDLVSRVLFSEGEWEPLLLGLAKEVVRDIPGTLVLDVGCNIGAFSIPMGDFLTNQGIIHAFDAQRSVFYQTCGACALNGLDNVYLHNLAVGEHPGSIDVPLLDLAATKSVGGLSLNPEYNRQRAHDFVFKSEVESVPMITLDTFLTDAQAAQVSLIKVDVEGFELEVFRGADKLLHNHYPTLLFEAWEGLAWYSKKREQLMQHVRALGYLLTTVGELILAQHPKGKANLIKLESINGELKISRVRTAAANSPCVAASSAAAL